MRKPLFLMSLVLSMLLCACGNSTLPTTNTTEEPSVTTVTPTTSEDESKKVGDLWGKYNV